MKTAGSKRTVDLSDFVFEGLREHRASQLLEREAAAEWDDPRLVFATSKGTLYRSENVARSLGKITVAAGLGNWTPNQLRHTAASLLVDGGVALHLVAKLLGHNDTRMVDQTYGHRIRESVDTGKAMESILRPGHKRAVVVRRRAK